jgi:hypothetical protein
MHVGDTTIPIQIPERNEKSHFNELHEKDETDLTHLEPHMHVGDSTIPIP